MADENKRDHRVYRGKVKNWTDEKGNNYPESFWILGLTADPVAKALLIQASGYPSKEDFDTSNVGTLSGNPGASRTYAFKVKDFDYIQMKYADKFKLIQATMWEILDDIKDTIQPDGSFDSFFANSEDVPFPGEQSPG